MKLDRYL